ncbi:MAG: DNA polymerase III subunit gamma/tau [Bacteroidia bacterium]
MENFVVSARKYRPATFDTVVGQEAITTTLKNAIKNNHLAQAFLFCGPRGVGKTTCARILAKTINCFNITDNIEACDQCESCVSFREGQSLNIYELDAASNNSVDDIRNLIDQVRIAPQLGTKKVYIIDEVHMLSTAAFNAFLKTLEEPPKHAIFILATTEKHKILPTILSRCQIFDFQRIKAEDIANHLAAIAQKEGYEAEPDGLYLIAQKADGGLRDALSMFDQIISYAGKISYQAVIENLNILDYDYYFKVIDSVSKRDIPALLILFNEILAKGFDGHNFLNGLMAHIRNLLVCKDVQTLILLDVGNNIKEKYKQQSAAIAVPVLVEMLNIINKFELNYKSSKNQRLLVELCLIQLCNIGVPPVTSAPAEEKKNDISQTAPHAVATNTKVSTTNTSSTIVNVSQQETNKVQTTNTLKSDTKETQDTKVTSINSFKSIKGVNNFSLSEIQKSEVQTQDKKDEDKLLNTSGPATPFTVDELSKFILEYANSDKVTGKKSLELALKFKKPHLNEDFSVVITVENEVQRNALRADLTEFTLFLREKLNNYKIVTSIEVAEGDTTKKSYTPRERFQKMAEKNPNLITLYNKLDLDLEF